MAHEGAETMNFDILTDIIKYITLFAASTVLVYRSIPPKL